MVQVEAVSFVALATLPINNNRWLAPGKVVERISTTLVGPKAALVSHRGKTK
jgi:hypothetical protein